MIKKIALFILLLGNVAHSSISNENSFLRVHMVSMKYDSNASINEAALAKMHVRITGDLTNNSINLTKVALSQIYESTNGHFAYLKNKEINFNNYILSEQRGYLGGEQLSNKIKIALNVGGAPCDNNSNPNKNCLLKYDRWMKKFNPNLSYAKPGAIYPIKVTTGMIIHEVGHQVGNQNSNYSKYYNEVYSSNKKGCSELTSYSSMRTGAHGIAEEFAEAFALYVLSPSDLKYYCRDSYIYFENLFSK